MSPAWVVDTWYWLRVEADGPMYYLYTSTDGVNFDLRHTADDSAWTGGGVGIHIHSDANSSADFNEITFEVPIAMTKISKEVLGEGKE